MLAVGHALMLWHGFISFCYVLPSIFSFRSVETQLKKGENGQKRRRKCLDKTGF